MKACSSGVMSCFSGMGWYFGASWKRRSVAWICSTGDVQALSDQRKVGVEILHLLAKEIAGDRGIVVDQQAAFAVEEPATRSEDRNLADAVGFGEDAVAVGSR